MNKSQAVDKELHFFEKCTTITRRPQLSGLSRVFAAVPSGPASRVARGRDVCSVGPSLWPKHLI